VFAEYQRQVEEERLRRLAILRQLEAERVRITLQRWARDREATACTQCQSVFTLLRRKVGVHGRAWTAAPPCAPLTLAVFGAGLGP
jgi:hypothetical protein